MSDLIGICTRILSDADYDLIPADVVVTGGKVRDWGIEQRNAEHGQGLALVSPKRVVMVQTLDGTQVIDAEFANNFPEYALGVRVKPREMEQSDEDYFMQCARGM